MDDDQDLVNRIFFDMMYRTWTSEEREILARTIEAVQ